MGEHCDQCQVRHLPETQDSTRPQNGGGPSEQLQPQILASALKLIKPLTSEAALTPSPILPLTLTST